MTQQLLQRVKAGVANVERDRRVALAEAHEQVTYRFDSALALFLDRTMNTFARRCYHGLYPLYWQRDDFPVDESVPSLTGMAGADYDDDEAVEVIETWARLFGLQLVEKPVEGTVEYRGQIEGIAVRVWAVTDRAVLNGDVQ